MSMWVSMLKITIESKRVSRIDRARKRTQFEA